MWRYRPRIFCAVPTALFLVAIGTAQDPIHQRYTTADGLPSNTVYGVVQDHRGFLWFGTDAGASRFDGRHFVSYGLREGSPDDEVLQCFEDSRHRVWLLLLNGKLAYVRNDTLFHPGNDPALRAVNGRTGWARACEDRKGNIWFGGVWAELLQLDTLGTFHTIDLKGAGIMGGNVTPLVDRSGDLFLQVNNEGFTLENGVLRRTHILTSSAPKIAYATGADGRIWAATKEGLQELNHQLGPVAITADRCGDWDRVRSMVLTDEHVLVYGRWDKGATLVDTSARAARSIFPQETINVVYLDDEGNCWLTTAGNGVLVFALDQLDSRIMDKWGDAPLGAISCLHPDRLGQLWVGTEQGMLLRMNGDLVQRYDLRLGDTRVQKVRALCDDGRFIYAATDMTTVRIPLSGEGPPRSVGQWDRMRNVLSPISPNKVLVTLRGGGLVGAYYELMRSTDPKNPMLYPYLSEQLGNGRFHLLFEDPDSALWIQRNDVLYRWYHQRLDTLHALCDGHGTRVVGMAALSDGTLVLGTVGHGLLFLRDGKVVRTLQHSDGLVSDRCHRVHVTNDTIALATPEGVDLVIVDPSADLTMRILEPGTDRAPAFDAVMLHGDLYVATANGLYITGALLPHRTPLVPRLYITHIASDERSFSPGRPFLLDHDHGSLVVEVTVVSMAQSMGTEFQYRIDEENKWTNSNTNVLALFTQQPGEHALQVRARVAGSEWSPAVVARFGVMPPFWERNLYRVPALFLLVLGVYLLLRFLAQRRYQKRLAHLRQMEMLSEERQRIAMDLHDDLGADLSGTAMLAEAALHSGQEMQQALSDTIARVRSMLPKVDEIIWALDARNDNLSALIEHLRRSASSRTGSMGVGFDFVGPHNFTDRVINSGFRRVAMLLAKESVINALKHAKADTIAMTISVDGDRFILEVQDNGQGIRLTAAAHFRHGIANMRARTKQLGGSILFCDVKPHGTRVAIDLPLPAVQAGTMDAA
ncbi:MAG: two-component regulator propeller domain-containing protein [Flavobacteriales bacterium]